MYTHVNLFIWIFSLYNRTPLYGHFPPQCPYWRGLTAIKYSGHNTAFQTLYQDCKCPAHNAYVNIRHWISISHALLLRELVSLKAQGAYILRPTSGILLATPSVKTRVNLATDLFKSQLQSSGMLCRGSFAPRQMLILSSAISSQNPSF